MMDPKRATDIVVRMAYDYPETTDEGQALRVILRELKTQRQVGNTLEASIPRLLAALDESFNPTQQELTLGGYR